MNQTESLFSLSIYHILENINLYIEIVHYGLLFNIIDLLNSIKYKYYIIIESMIKVILIIRNKLKNLIKKTILLFNKYKMFLTIWKLRFNSTHF